MSPGSGSRLPAVILPRSIRLSLTAFATCVVAASIGCAGDGPPPSPGPAPGATLTPGNATTIDEIQRLIFDVRCLTSGCHNVADRAGNLVLEPGLSRSNLVNVIADNPAAAQAGLRRVVPFDPGGSFLLIKVEHPGPGQGSRMPLGGPFLSPGDVALVRRWIIGGALASGASTATPVSTSTATRSPTPSATASPTEPPPPTATGTLPSTATPTATATQRVLTFAEIQSTIFTPSCAVQFCHQSAALPFAVSPDLSEDAAFSSLVGVRPDNSAAASAGLLRVRRFEPESSFLLIKLCRPQHGQELCPVPLIPAYGSPMPLVGAPLSSEQIGQLRAWILRGAPQSE